MAVVVISELEKINYSVGIVETVPAGYMSAHCDHELEDSKPIFLHDTLAHDDASQYQVWLQKVQQLRRYHPDEHSLDINWTNTDILILHCDLNLECSNPFFFTRHSGLC